MTSRSEKTWNYIILTVMALIVLWPVGTFVAAAVSPDRAGRPSTDLQWGNFATAWQQAEFAQSMTVSLIITASVVVLSVLLALMGGYAFGVLGVLGEKFLFPLILLGMMISLEVIIVPLYYQFRSLGLTDNLLGVILIHTAMGVPFGVFWMRAAFRTLPRAVFESAELDGAGAFRMLWSIAAPNIMPAVYTLILLNFMWTWNDYFLSLVFLHGDNQTATVALGVFQGKYVTQVNLMAAGGLIVAAPVLILYVIFQRKFISGMLAGAIKE
ncbi:carbohydrate ABC transporter permease [Microbacterium azadirachtae]|uniref:Carbohydrate ABC transporter membrane protein 2, CUT1 family n=1 Tax=Microbacterium azadirachtae TaxID=582680 RepID=A0A1I6G9Q0_9MICO|nr:carbohydrate ABC transporter permease [Microbacterium azadirachtae]SDL38337.1 carbohydrate ABC transporter membrane protein 2, CUT1 family [Microbacterium azadirachtae]SEF69321.1 carbohydrate ABC transporter membrane protein 2, CUT1 family [Microbacterium azadirachtae]SEF70039.1 carbohydrate ABC transporter membrane protein 2, CUT1 family [Microbacterium azadirachtae]SFR38861.1 carbohydrate ABC transporter membrane protein 2, CUT1 family [Microbacterium azadirachtae]